MADTLKTIELDDLGVACGATGQDLLDRVSSRDNYVKTGEAAGPGVGAVYGTALSGGNPAGDVLGFVTGKEYGGAAMGALNDAGSWIGKKVGGWVYPG